MKVIVKSTGCRLNQFESDYINSQFLSQGDTNVKNNADICIINTCTVTHEADVKTIKLIRKLKRENPHAKIIATGCMVETDSTALKKIDCIDDFVSNKDKFRIFTFKSQVTKYQPNRTRPFIKIQEGCNFQCTYCKVRLARGKSQSVRMETILEMATNLVKQGYHEIVLTGINIGDYSYHNYNLAHLLQELIKINRLKFIRLSSIEPTHMTDELIDVIRNNKICKYLHIPLQSGSNKILKLMNRPYTVQEYKERIDKIKGIDSDIILGTDIIVGFPGEEENDFQNTYDLLKKNQIFYLHVFRYSPREKTEAYQWGDTVPSKVKLQRAQILNRYMKEAKEDYFHSLMNSEKEVIIENKIINNIYISSVSTNYLKILLPWKRYHKNIGDFRKVKIHHINQNQIYAN